MKFSEMKYERPVLDEVKAQLSDLCRRFEATKDYAEAKKVFLEKEDVLRHVSTMLSSSTISYSFRCQ